jgi:predicted dithiol-disulfide oxidoreductase (DUF899 family)
MTIGFPGESTEYRTARERLLGREIALRRAMEEVAALRRALPPGGAVPEDYVFQGAGADGAPTDVRLSELFVSGKDSLVIYSFMFPRDPDDASPGPLTVKRPASRSRKDPARRARRCSTSSTARPSMRASTSTWRSSPRRRSRVC